jgi:diadenosine tetraphosphate (Ap4A) HIT family hydrolase
MADDCVFCGRVDRGEHDAGDAFAVTFRPLKPVGPGHRLFVPKVHVADALTDPMMTAMTSALRAQAPSFTAGIARALTGLEVKHKHASISA